MKLHQLLLSLVSIAVLFAGLLSAQAGTASQDTVWLEGLVLTKAGKVARNAEIVLRDADGNKIPLYNNYGDEVTEVSTDRTGNFVLTYLPVSDDAYTVVIKHSGDTYRLTMLIDDQGHLGHQAELFRLATTESSAIDLDDEYTYYRAGMRDTDNDGRVIYLETRTPETGYPYTEVYSYHVESGKVRHMDELMKKVGSAQRNSVEFSIDGRHVVAASSQELKVWHVTTLDRVLKRTLDDDEYYASRDGLLADYEIEWLDNKCVQAAIYQAASSADDEERDFLEYRTYCL